jgi:Zn-dependent peptidase ImmA (M78 family)
LRSTKEWWAKRVVVRRGFKAWCEKVAADARRQHGLAASAPLSARSVAEKNGVLVLSVADIPNINEACVRQLTEVDPTSWSAATIIHPKAKLIIYNCAHAEGRQSSSIMHEMAHIICGHDAAKAEYLPGGLMMLKAYDKEQEEEADLLAATLLLPRVALVSIMSSGIAIEDAAEAYNVSVDLMKMRLQRAGVYMQFKRRRY